MSSSHRFRKVSSPQKETARPRAPRSQSHTRSDASPKQFPRRCCSLPVTAFLFSGSLMKHARLAARGSGPTRRARVAAAASPGTWGWRGSALRAPSCLLSGRKSRAPGAERDSDHLHQQQLEAALLGRRQEGGAHGLPPAAAAAELAPPARAEAAGAAARRPGARPGHRGQPHGRDQAARQKHCAEVTVSPLGTLRVRRQGRFRLLLCIVG